MKCGKVIAKTKQLIRIRKKVLIMSSSEAILEAIRQRRETRDMLMFEQLVPILSDLRRIVNTWIEGEFRDLEEEVSHVDSFAIRDSASERISRFIGELSEIRNNRLPNALRQLDELIESIKQQKFQSSEEATDMLKEKVNPVISLIFSLSNARERLDGMADMIPLPPLPSRERHQRNDEE